MKNQIADTILQQMGGKSFIMMTGASNLVAGPNYLQFRLKPGTKNKCNTVKIELMADDTYTVWFYYVRGIKATIRSSHEGIYADMLQDLFEEQTGLYTTMKKRG